MPYQSDKILDEAIAIAIKDTDIQNGLAETNYPAERLAGEVKVQASEVWAPVLKDIADFDQTEGRIDDFILKHPFLYKAGQKRSTRTFFKPVWLVILFEALFIIQDFGPVFFPDLWPSLLVYQPMYKQVNDTLLSFLLAAGIFTLQNVILFNRWLGLWDLTIRYYYRFVFFLARRDSRRLYAQCTMDVAHLGMVSNLLKDSLREKGVKEVMRKILNEHIAVSYQTTFDKIETTGLGEVLDATRTISTQAREQMDYLLNHMPGGSIGIAGSRGAGKSTLIQLYCGRDRIVPEMNGRLVLPVMASAPVKYEARDFILYLFKSVCRAYLNIDGNNNRYLQRRYERGSAVPISSLWLNHLKPVCFIGGLILIMVSPLLRWSYVADHPGKASPKRDTIYIKNITQPDKATVVSRSPNTDIDALTSSFSQLFHSLDEPKAAVDTNKSFFAYYRTAFSRSYNSASDCLFYGTGLFVIWMLLAFIDRRARRPLGSLLGRRYFSEEQWLDGTGSSRDKSQLAKDAVKWLEKIDFQQSFTSGWSGGIKLPYIESGTTRSNTLTEKPLSNPEIVAAFADFLKDAAQIYQVIIGIDELDKLESAASAEQFLNDIKSIFGIPRCFFLISVSEDAMSNFERRGLPFRDVFDSAFDSIVYVEYLDLESTKRLLQRRVIGRPAVFFCLAYCFAGGLPRDVIRYFRDIARLSADTNELAAITARLVSDDVTAKLRAIAFSIKKYRTHEAAGKLLDLLFGDPAELTTGKLESMLNKLKRQMTALSSEIKKQQSAIGTDTIPPTLAEQWELLGLMEEVYAYLAFITTLYNLFTSGLDEAKIQQIEQNKGFEALAEARQILAVDKVIALKKINACRSKEGFAVFG
ncbi:hypothetical protein HQ865_24905 [Mucilaginibacter mali]|uniref:KAP NTPase domain-containing protein n=1 Tax=Mucilaginibacter mali TaxID=2740462 RepID=A0A7D4UDU9_9SPHI|nr:hypothetical protein [Mucilaginibacter mali]QKJ32858.1 hypothetical protein HQ865_24905 [Mucilaginibacter mali]